MRFLWPIIADAFCVEKGHFYEILLIHKNSSTHPGWKNRWLTISRKRESSVVQHAFIIIGNSEIGNLRLREYPKVSFSARRNIFKKYSDVIIAIICGMHVEESQCVEKFVNRDES